MQQVITMPIKNNEILCSKCDEKIDPPYIVRYDGRDFHHSCFTAATTETTDMKRNPHITMTMDPHTVKVMLEAMEGFLDSPIQTREIGAAENFRAALNCNRLRNEVKDAYASVALRLSQAGRNIAQCHHCNRARYYSGMVRGGSSKKKILEILGGILMIWRVKLVREKLAEENARVLLFCNAKCDAAFTERPLKERISGFDEIRDGVKARLNPVAAAAAKANPQPTETEAWKEKVAARAQEKLQATMKDKECAECGQKHVNDECGECGAWLGKGLCALQHAEGHTASHSDSHTDAPNN